MSMIMYELYLGKPDKRTLKMNYKGQETITELPSNRSKLDIIKFFDSIAEEGFDVEYSILDETGLRETKIINSYIDKAIV